MATGARTDPYRSYNFRIEIDGIDRAGFQECTSPGSEQAPVEYREGTEALTARKLPGLVTYADVTLRRGITQDASLFEWRKKAMEGNVERRNVSIVLMDDTGEEVVRWNLRECWPRTYTAPAFNASQNSVAVESLVLAHEGMTVA
jgi:phage tail-like protein